MPLFRKEGDTTATALGLVPFCHGHFGLAIPTFLRPFPAWNGTVQAIASIFQIQNGAVDRGDQLLVSMMHCC
jgi:hypothetical protein